MAMITENPRNIPLVKALFPSYRKRKVFIEPTTRVTFYDLNWSGGSQSRYTAVDLRNGAAKSMSTWNQIAPWDNVYEGASVELKPGFAIVRTGYFCGKESTLTIYVHPDNMPHLLTREQS